MSRLPGRLLHRLRLGLLLALALACLGTAQAGRACGEATAPLAADVERAMDLAARTAQALEASGLPQECPDWERQGLSFSVWGRAQPADHRLRDQDRVEVLRPLRVDPKVARRERFSQQGSRAAGLFSRGPRR